MHAWSEKEEVVVPTTCEQSKELRPKASMVQEKSIQTSECQDDFGTSRDQNQEALRKITQSLLCDAERGGLLDAFFSSQACLAPIIVDDRCSPAMVA